LKKYDENRKFFSGYLNYLEEEKNSVALNYSKIVFGNGAFLTYL